MNCAQTDADRHHRRNLLKLSQLDTQSTLSVRPELRSEESVKLMSKVNTLRAECGENKHKLAIVASKLSAQTARISSKCINHSADDDYHVHVDHHHHELSLVQLAVLMIGLDLIHKLLFC